MTALQVTMAAGFGALAAQTAVAVGAFLVAPTVWSVVGPLLFGANAQWLDVFSAYDQLSSDAPLTEPAADPHRDRRVGGAADHHRGGAQPAA